MPIRRPTVLLFPLLLAAALAAAAPTGGRAPDNPGAETLRLEGGETGDVTFPHRRHQQTLTDCQVCHSLFPQQAGVIEELKARGELEKKQVMNKLCTRCHREYKAQGKATGPTTCTTCHVKGA